MQTSWLNQTGNKPVPVPFPGEYAMAEVQKMKARKTASRCMTSASCEAALLPQVNHTSLHDPKDANLDIGDALVSLVCNRILPQLSAPYDVGAVPDPNLVSKSDVDNLRFCIAVADPEPTLAMLRQLKHRGLSRQAVLLDLFTPVAHQLNQEWMSKTCSFSEMTLGIARLARLMRSEAMPPLRRRDRDDPRTILLASFAVENRNFGLLVLEEQFKTDGWNTQTAFGISADDLCERVEKNALDVVNISLASDYQYAAVANLVRRLRRLSCNPDIIVLVGGATFSDNPSCALALGADGTARSTVEAFTIATTLLQSRVENEAISQ